MSFPLALPSTPPPIHTVTERPRERLLRTGTVTLGDKELLALLIGTGVRERPAIEVAGDLMRRSGGIAGISRASPRACPAGRRRAGSVVSPDIGHRR